MGEGRDPVTVQTMLTVAKTLVAIALLVGVAYVAGVIRVRDEPEPEVGCYLVAQQLGSTFRTIPPPDRQPPPPGWMVYFLCGEELSFPHDLPEDAIWFNEPIDGVAV